MLPFHYSLYIYIYLQKTEVCFPWSANDKQESAVCFAVYVKWVVHVTERFRFYF
jgi:hypothetical protein